jgi:hypothetical protein
MSEETKKRGAPKGRRPVIWVCAGTALSNSATNGASVVCEKILVKDMAPESDSGKFPKEVAIASYKEKYNVEPTHVLGPFYEKKGKQQAQPSKKKGTICRNISDVRLSSKQKRGIFGDWYGMVNFLEGDDNNVFFVFLREKNPDPKKKKEVPRPGTIKVSDIEFCEEIPAE